MTLRLPRLSDTWCLRVIPAKAGIQALNGSRAVRAISKAMCVWLRPCTLGRFSLLAQRKATKRKGTPWSAPASPVPSRRAGLRGCADATSLSRRRTLAIPRSPLRARASATLGAQLDQGGLKTYEAGA